jgi:hypothetical protein
MDGVFFRGIDKSPTPIYAPFPDHKNITALIRPVSIDIVIRIGLLAALRFQNTSKPTA